LCKSEIQFEWQNLKTIASNLKIGKAERPNFIAPLTKSHFRKKFYRIFYRIKITFSYNKPNNDLSALFLLMVLAKTQQSSLRIIELIRIKVKNNFVFKNSPTIFEKCYLQQQFILHPSIFTFEAKVESELCIV